MVEKELDELSRLALVELSLVNRGANQKKRFPIFKTEEFMDMQEIMKAVLETEVEGEAQLEEFAKAAKVSEKGAAAAKSALRILSAFKDELPGDLLTKLEEISGIEKGCGPGGGKGKDYAKKSQSKDEYAYPEPGMKKSVKKWIDEMPAELREQVQKAEIPAPKPAQMPPEAEAIFKAQQDELAEVRKALKVETDKREMAEWTEKVKSDLSHYPGKSASELALMLKQLNDVNPEVAAAQFEMMKAASVAMKESSVLKSAGARGASASGSAWEQIETLANGLVEKASDGLTKEQAIAKVMGMKPELYAQYLTEHPKQSATV